MRLALDLAHLYLEGYHTVGSHACRSTLDDSEQVFEELGDDFLYQAVVWHSLVLVRHDGSADDVYIYHAVRLCDLLVWCHLVKLNEGHVVVENPAHLVILSLRLCFL